MEIDELTSSMASEHITTIDTLVHDHKQTLEAAGLELQKCHLKIQDLEKLNREAEENLILISSELLQLRESYEDELLSLKEQVTSLFPPTQVMRISH